jgi:hypothetical protein
MSAMTTVCWTAWIIVLFMINPLVTNWIGFVMFYSSLFLALVGTAALTGFIIRFIALKQELAWRLVKEAFRQSFLFSMLIVISLILLSKDLFSWLNLLFLILGLSILEFFLISYGRPGVNINK